MARHPDPGPGARVAGRRRRHGVAACACPCRPTCPSAGTPCTRRQRRHGADERRPHGRMRARRDARVASPAAARPATAGGRGGSWRSSTRCARAGRGASATSPTSATSPRSPGARGADFLLVNPVHAAEVTSPHRAVAVPAGDPPVPRAAVRASRRTSARRRTSPPTTAPLSRDCAEPVAASNTDAVAHRPRRGVGGEARRARGRLRRAALAGAAGARSTPSSQREGRPLADFALWCALEEHYAATLGAGRGAPGRGVGHRVAAGRASCAGELADRVAFHSWLQWIADEQVARRAGRREGRRACASASCTTSRWACTRRGRMPGRCATCTRRASRVGAPPDMYNQQGQNWNQPPWLPNALGRARLRAAARHDPHPAAPRRRPAHRPHHRLLPAVVDPGGTRRGRRHVRPLRPRGDDRRARARGASRRRRRHRRGPRQRRAVGARLPVVARHPGHLRAVVRVRGRRLRRRRSTTARRCSRR